MNEDEVIGPVSGSVYRGITLIFSVLAAFLAVTSLLLALQTSPAPIRISPKSAQYGNSYGYANYVFEHNQFQNPFEINTSSDYGPPELRPPALQEGYGYVGFVYSAAQIDEAFVVNRLTWQRRAPFTIATSVEPPLPATQTLAHSDLVAEIIAWSIGALVIGYLLSALPPWSYLDQLVIG